MTINYALHENPLPNVAAKYRAMVISRATLDMKAVIKRMVERAGVNEGQAQMMVELFFTTVEDLLLEGFKLRTAYLIAGLSLRGNFESSTDLYQPKRHRLKVTFSAGSKIRRAIRSQARLHRQEPHIPQPCLHTYLDANSGQHDSLITPGGIGQINGKWLKYDPADPRQGIFFKAADNRPHRVEVVAINTSQQLVFQIPTDLSSGLYHLEVHALLTEGKPRQGRLDVPLRVE